MVYLVNPRPMATETGPPATYGYRFGGNGNVSCDLWLPLFGLTCDLWLPASALTCDLWLPVFNRSATYGYRFWVATVCRLFAAFVSRIKSSDGRIVKTTSRILFLGPLTSLR